MISNPLIDRYLTEGCMRCSLGGTSDCKVHNWTEELKLLREIVLGCGLKEDLKWGVPCYSFKDKNILIVSALKKSVTMAFVKGALLSDEHKLLVKAGENSQATRLFRFTSVQEILEIELHIRAYIFEAVEIEKAGLKVEFKKRNEPIPKELLDKFEEDGFFKDAFYALTPGRQRGYILHFSQPKQSKTRYSRIENWKPTILRGEGIHDAYRKKKN